MDGAAHACHLLLPLGMRQRLPVAATVADPTPSSSNRGGTAAPPEPRAGAYSARRAAVALRAMSVRPPASNSAEHAGPWSRLQTMLLGGPTLRRARRQQEREHDAHSPSFASASSSSRALHSPLPGLSHGPDLWSCRPNVSARSLPHDGSSAAPSPGRDAHARTPAPTPRSEGGAWAAAAASPAWLSRREQQEAAQLEVQAQQQQQHLLPSCWSAFVFQTLQRDPATGQLLLLPLGHSTLVLASLMTALTGPAIASASASSAFAPASPDSQSDALNPSHPASLSVAGLLQSVGLDPSFASSAAPRQLPSDRDLLVALQHAASGQPPPAPPPPPRPNPTSYCIPDLPSTLPSSTASSRVSSEPSSPRAAAIAPMQPPGRAAEQVQGGAWGSPAKSTSSSGAGSGTGGSGDVPLDDVPLASYRRVTDSVILPQLPNGVPEISGWPFGGGGSGGGEGGGGGRGSGGGGPSDEDGGWWGEEGGSWWSGRCQRLLELLPVCLSLALVLPPAAVQELAAAAARRLRFPATPRLPPPDAARTARIAAARGRYERAVMRLLYGEWQPPTGRRSTTVRDGRTTARTVPPTADEAVQALAELAPSGPRQLVGLLAAVRRRLEADEAEGARAAAVGVVGRAVDRAVAEEQVARVREEAEEQLRREREEGAEKLLRAREEGEEKLARARKEAEADMRVLQVQGEAAAAKLRVQREEAVRKLQLQREEAAAKMEAQREEGAAKLQAQREEAAAKMEAQREEAAAKLQLQHEEAAAKLQAQLCTLCSDFEVQLAVEKREAEGRLAAVRAEASAQLAAAREAGARQLAVEREEAGRQLAAVRQEAAAQVAATREEAAGLLATTREAASRQLAAARDEAERQLAGAMEEAMGQLAAAREEAAGQLATTREAAGRQLAAARDEAERQLAEAREDAVAQLAAANEEAAGQLAAAREEAAGQLAAAREEAEAALQREREALQLESYRASEARRQHNEAAAAASLAAASAASACLLSYNASGPHSHSHGAAAGGSNGCVEVEEGDEAQGGRAKAAASRAPRKGLALSSGEQNGNGSGARSSPQGGDAMARVVLTRGVGAADGRATGGSDGGGGEGHAAGAALAGDGEVGALHEANKALVAVVSDLTAALDQERDVAARALRSEREAAARKLAEAEARLRGEAVRKLAESEAELRQETARKLRDLDAVARDTLRDVAASVSVSLDRLQRTGDRAREVRDRRDDLRDQHEGALLRRAEGAEGALVRAVVAGALDKAALHAQVQELQEQLTAVVSGFEAMVMGGARAQEQELGADGAVVALAEQEPQDRSSAPDRDEPLPAAGDERALIASLLSQVTAMQAHVLALQADMAVTDGELARTAAATADTSALPFIPDSASGILPTPSTATGNVAGVSPSPRLSACGGPHYHWPDMQELLQVAAGAAGLMREAAAGSGSGSGAAVRSGAGAVAAVAAGQGTGMETAAVGSYGTPARVLFRADSEEDPSGVAAVAAGGAGGEGTDPVLLGSPQQSNSPDFLLQQQQQQQQQRDLPPMLPHPAPGHSPALPPSGNGFAPSQQPVSSSQKARSLLVSSSPVLLRALLRNRSSVAALQQAGSPHLSPSRPLAEQVAQLQARITAMTRILHRADEQLAAVAAQRQQEVQQDGPEIQVRTSVQHNPLYLSDPTATSQIVAVLPPRHGSTGGLGSTVLHSSPSASHKVVSVPPSSAMLPSAPGEKLPVPRHPRYETGLGATAAETDSPLRSSSPFAAAARAAMPRPGLPLGEEEEEVMSASVRTSMEDVGTFSSPWPPSFPTTDPGNLAYDHKATRNRIPTELGTEPEEADAIVAAAAAAAAAGQQQAAARRKAAASTAAVAATAACHKRGQPQQPGRQEASLKQQQQLQRSPGGGKGRTSASGAATSSSLLEQPRWRLSRTTSQLTSASLLRAGSGGAFGAAAAAGSSSPAQQPAPPLLLSTRSFSSQHGLPLGSPYGGSSSGAAVGRGRRTSYLVLSPSPSNPAPSSIASSSGLLPMQQQQQQRPPWSVAGPSTKYRRAASGQLPGSGLLQGRASLPGAGSGGVTGGGSSYSVGSSSCASSMVGTPRTTPSGYYSRTSAPATGAAAALLLAQERARQQEREGERERQSRQTRQQGQQGQGLVAAAAAAAEARQRQAAAARGSSSGSAAKGQGGEQEQERERGGGRVQALAAALSARGGAATASAAASAATAPRAPLLKPLVTGRVGPAPAAAAAASDVGVAKEEMHAAAAAAAPPQGAREDEQAATDADAAVASVVSGSVAAAQQRARDGGRDREEEPGWGSSNSSGPASEAAMAETGEGQREQHVAADKAAEEERGHGWGEQEPGVGTHAQPPHGEQDGEDEDEEEAELSGEGADRLTPLVMQLQHVPHPLPLGFQHPLLLGHAPPAGGNVPPPPPLSAFSTTAKGGAGEARPDADAAADPHQRSLVVPAFPPSPSPSQRDLDPHAVASEPCHLGPSSASLPVPLPLHLVAPHLLLPHTYNHRASLGGGGGGGHDDGIDGDCRVSAPAGGGFSCGLIPRLGSFGRRRSSNGGGPSPATSRQGSFLSMGRRSSRVLPDPLPSPGAATAAAHSQRATDGGVLTLRGPGMAPETAAAVAGSYNPHSTGDRSLSASLASSAYSFVVQPDGGTSTAAGSTVGGGTGDRGSGGGGAAKRSFSERIKRQLGKMVPGLGGAAAGGGGGEGGGDSSSGGGRGAAAAMGGAPWAAIAELGQ